MESLPLRKYRSYEWRIAAALFAGQLAVGILSANLVPESAQFYPGVAIALTALFFGGLRLWPVAYLASLLVWIAKGETGIILLMMPAGITLQALAGAALLREGRLDPIFRRNRDMFTLLATVITVSFVTPTFQTFARALAGEVYTPTEWGYGYLASVFSLIIISPFILRWATKPRFSPRSPQEVLETAMSFVVLVIVNFALFVLGIDEVVHIPLLYILLAPLFLISLRLRPRFVTLALMMTSLFALSGTIASASPVDLAEQLFRTEAFLVALAAIFLIVTSLEEDRRVNTNLMLSHLAALENAVAQVSSESRAKNDFIAMLAHELRNPLAPIVSAIDLLKLQPRDAEDKETLDMMADRMLAIRRLLDDLLDISRISEGKITLKREPVDLERVMRRALLSTEHYRSELQQKLMFVPPPQPLVVLGDPIRIEQIFTNLLANASKYSNPQQTIEVQMRERSGSAEIDVIDEGIGLAPDEIEKIFQPFSQIEHGERTTQGLGIGLSLVQSFVEMHGGTITATSKGRGRGARFCVTLPLHSVPSVPALSPPAETRALVADENDAVAGSIGRLLELLGCNVLYAYDSRQVLEKAVSARVDIIFMNIDMPHRHAAQMADTLRKRGYTGALVALTARRVDGLTACERDGFDDFVVKPVGLQELRRVLTTH